MTQFVFLTTVAIAMLIVLGNSIIDKHYEGKHRGGSVSE